MDIVKNRI